MVLTKQTAYDAVKLLVREGVIQKQTEIKYGDIPTTVPIGSRTKRYDCQKVLVGTEKGKLVIADFSKFWEQFASQKFVQI